MFDGATQRARSNTAPTVGVSYYIVGTWDTTNMKLYLGTTSAAPTLQSITDTSTLPDLSADQPNAIGSNRLGGENFNGIIDEVEVNNRALHPLEIQRNWMATKDR